MAPGLEAAAGVTDWNATLIALLKRLGISRCSVQWSRFPRLLCRER